MRWDATARRNSRNGRRDGGGRSAGMGSAGGVFGRRGGPASYARRGISSTCRTRAVHGEAYGNGRFDHSVER